MIQTVVKRDGRIVGFNEAKIASAIRKTLATEEVEADGVGSKFAELFTIKTAVMDADTIKEIKEAEVKKPVPVLQGIVVGSNDSGKSKVGLLGSLARRTTKTLKEIKKHVFSGHASLFSQLNSKEKEILGESFRSNTFAEEEFQSLLQHVLEQKQRIESRKEEISQKNGSRIGNRVYNQRPSEDHICEKMRDEVVLQLMPECFKIIGIPFALSRKLKKGLCIIVTALFENKDVRAAEEASDRSSADVFGKVAQIHRAVERHLGEELIGCGLRTLQKSVAWLKAKAKQIKETEKEMHEAWVALKDRVAAYLEVRIPQMVTPP